MLRILFTLFVLIFTVSNFSAQENSNTEDKVEENAPDIKAIPVTEITNKANEVQLSLEKISKHIEEESETSELRDKINLLLDSIDALNPEKQIEDIGNYNERQILTIQQNWSILFEKSSDLQDELNEISVQLSKEADELNTLLETWKLTAKDVYVGEVPITIRKRVQTVINSIERTIRVENDYQKSLLIFQENISKRQLQISRLLASIDELNTTTKKNIFAKDALPLWQALSEPEDTVQIVSFKELANDIVASNSLFIYQNKGRFILHLIIFLFLIGYFYYLKYKVVHKKLIIKTAAQTQKLLYFLQKPIATGIIMGIFFSIWLYPISSMDFRQFIVLISIIPSVLLVPLNVNKSFKRIVYIIAILAAINFVQMVINTETVMQRFFLLITSAIALSITILIYISQRKGDIKDWNSLGKIIIRLNPFIFLLALGAIIFNFLGIVKLSESIYIGVVKGLYFALLFSIVDNILTGLSGILFRKQRKNAFLRIAEYAPKIEKTIGAIIHLIIIFYWFRATTVSFGVFTIIEKGWNTLMDLSWEVGNTKLELSTIITFILILVISGILARTIRIILDLEVFTRVKLPRGVPGTISMVTRYTIVGFGIFLAISTITDLSKLGVMTGAIGVGLGFGLQNVIANFVSGIIISFERPMQVGDLVEINNIMGNVDEIGVRSSTIKTFDGSEVVVPNNDFISTQFTNWTLTDPKRRIKLNVKVALGANPHEVIVLLQKIVDAHEGVHANPEPIVTFDGYGDYYLEFTMYYWISDNILKYKSEVALQVYDQILAANLQIPQPKQDLNVRLKDSDQF